MSKIDTLRLDEVNVRDDEDGLVTLCTMMAGHEEQEPSLDVDEVRKLRDWLTTWLAGSSS